METLQLLRSLLEAIVILALTFLAGLASCLSLWVMPLIMLPMNTSSSMVAQFNETIRRGGKFLQPSSRALAIPLVLLAVLTSQDPDPAIAGRWKFYAVAGAIIVQAAWYEIVFIFPINDEVKAMGDKIQNDQDSPRAKADRATLISLFQRWQRLQWGRVLLPLAAGIVALLAVF